MLEYVQYHNIWLCVGLGVGLLVFSAGGVSICGKQGKEGVGCGDGVGALTGHLRKGAQGLAAGIAVTAKRVVRFCLAAGCSDVCVRFFFLRP